MKAWKGFAAESGSTVGFQSNEFSRPVLVIDASEFPDVYPEIGSEWLWCSEVVKVEGFPIYDEDLRLWEVTVRMPSGQTLPCDITILEPIPQQATGEVVGTVEVVDTGAGTTITLTKMTPPPGKYNLIPDDS